MFTAFVHYVVWALVRLRYRVIVTGGEGLEALRGTGALFLPNHPAEIDPVIVMTFLWKSFHPRPLVVDTFYRQKGINFFMRRVRALAVPSLEEGGKNGWKLHKLRTLFRDVAEGLRAGSNFLIYPSGRLKTSSDEKLGGASFVYNLVQECPDVPIVLVRTRGLWGSRFSRALTGNVPDFGKVFLESFVLLLKNGIFFAPKRSVYIDLEIASKEMPRHGGRLAFNAYLEKWYNKKPDMLQRVSNHFWSSHVPPVFEAEKQKTPEVVIQIPKDIEEAVLQKIAQLAAKPVHEISRAQDLTLDLGLDSLDRAQVYLFLDSAYDIEKEACGVLRTVEDVMRAALGAQERIKKEHKPVGRIKQWLKKEKRPRPDIPSAQTIHEAFIVTCLQMKGRVACADSLSGIWTYRKLMQTTLVLARFFRKYPEKHVGVLMPSSVAAYLVIVSLMLAKKVPVMLNWTMGTWALDHAFSLTDMRVVISSDRFLDRVEQAEWGGVLEHLLCLEQIREKNSWKDKLIALCTSFLGKKQALQGDLDANAEAVILFTSGTEAVPKAVPLTHKQLLSNQRAALSCVEFTDSDILYGVLPPFHSFGFSVTGIFPLIAGLKVYYAPDPTDARALVHDIAFWRPTLFICAPSFIKNVFEHARPEELRSLRLVAAGAEKVPEVLFTYISSYFPWIELLEGYGITECSPIVTLCRPGAPHKGVGQPLPGIELKILEEEQQEICIHGPSVFDGYLGTQKDCFLFMDGKKWYRSGDRGWIDADGTLFLSGRLKRFVKIGGEMVSLAGLEQSLEALAEKKQWIAPAGVASLFAVSALEKEGDKPIIILFTNLTHISREEVNTALQEAGFGSLVKITKIHHMDQIPLTATGKIHYRALDEMVL